MPGPPTEDQVKAALGVLDKTGKDLQVSALDNDANVTKIENLAIKPGQLGMLGSLIVGKPFEMLRQATMDLHQANRNTSLSLAWATLTAESDYREADAAARARINAQANPPHPR
jgi:hypothetical protein